MSSNPSAPLVSPDPSGKVGLLEEALLDPNPAVLRYFNQSGQLDEVIPEWARLNSARNIQHNAHHFPLNEHTLKVIERTKSSYYFRHLTDYQQLLVTLAALLHDIDKITGPERIRDLIPVDKLHPVKSAEVARDILTRLDYPPETVQRIYTLIHHHQVFGRLFIIYPESAPQHELDKIALKIRSSGVLECLTALSEGDIRAVQKADAFFTPRVADLLADYMENVKTTINGFRRALPVLPQTVYTLKTNPDALDLERSACFTLSADTPEALFARLGELRWGGTALYPYYHSLKPLEEEPRPYHALIRFLPENVAYIGPLPEQVLPESIGMNLFYNILLGKPMHGTDLSPADDRMLHAFLDHKETLVDLLLKISREQGYDNWIESFCAYESGRFEPSMTLLPVDPLQKSCRDALNSHFPGGVFGLGTRPIVQGFVLKQPYSQTMSKNWQGVPIYHIGYH